MRGNFSCFMSFNNNERKLNIYLLKLQENITFQTSFLYRFLK